VKKGTAKLPCKEEVLERASCLTVYFFSVLPISEEVAFLHYRSCVVVPIKIKRGMFKM